MPPRGQGRKSGRPSAPAPRAPSTPRQQKYVQYNTRPGEVGTRTGIAMRENVPRNEQGLEDPEAFFHSSPPAASRSNATPGGNGFLTSSPPMPPPPSTGKRRPRMSDMNNDSDEGADPLVADGLLDDEYELEKITPPPITHESSPNPPASVPQRRRKDQDQDENPFRPVAAESPPKANGIDSSSDEDMVSQNGGFDANDLEMDVAGQLQETHINEEEIEDEDSQPVRHRRKSDGTKGPHPVTSSGVPDSVNPTTDAEPIDGDDYSDTGEPFGDTEDHSDASQLFDDNEPDPTGDIEDAEPDLDSNDVSLEQRAIADESGEVTEEGDSVEYPADKAERGIKRTATVTPLKKVKRKSQIAPNEGHQYEGDFVCRRSGRNHFKPLEWWRGEHKEYKQGTFGPEIVSIVRVPDEVTTKPRATSRKPRGRGRGRSQTGRLHSASAAPPEELPGMKYLNMDYEVNSMTTVRDYITGQEVVRSMCFQRVLPLTNRDIPAVLSHPAEARSGWDVLIPEGLWRGWVHRWWCGCHSTRRAEAS
ncbi:hypothetical protein CC85DRAFT_205800 [Cutaneotrichosporon oleaginosum]|uniref:Uncharacterized protein n=1 Tax=Cutaneotrichosporon oleaginosum TaxID=879819 RepID=A0A0J0XDI8_9TREE|nr:uncharacterized protein CC85DRAFT_205800 [Cutaneotrichosporon oleaginosum]KLT39160.1 hypothetical protein CC85DRAFT_205800 [Cutaneotrichosporon oleaginosum]TXT05322.1 hypothetical protein COLE_06642 [Cutaneotrichosporon oleaginosum]